jgi:hypothetical protein
VHRRPRNCPRPVLAPVPVLVPVLVFVPVHKAGKQASPQAGPRTPVRQAGAWSPRRRGRTPACAGGWTCAARGRGRRPCRRSARTRRGGRRSGL